MPTWPEIQAYVRGKYTLAKDEEHRFAIIFKEQENRSQQIWVRHFNAMNQEFIEFRSYICKEDELAPKVALRKNAELSVGFIALIESHYVLLANVPMKSMDVEEFELPLHAIAITADQLEKTYSSERDAY
jgi:hypothetical protein